MALISALILTGEETMLDLEFKSRLSCFCSTSLHLCFKDHFTRHCRHYTLLGPVSAHLSVPGPLLFAGEGGAVRCEFMSSLTLRHREAHKGQGHSGHFSLGSLASV